MPFIWIAISHGFYSFQIFLLLLFTKFREINHKSLSLPVKILFNRE